MEKGEEKICLYCGHELKESVYAIVGSRRVKSCPQCSQEKGEHVFLVCPDKFGYRKLQSQSQCSKCRSKGDICNDDLFLCREIVLKGEFPSLEIRIIPMNQDEVSDVQTLHQFLLNEVRERGNRYYFKKKAKISQGAFILFQWDAGIVGMAHCQEVRIYEKPINGYKGEYIFIPDSLKLFSKPIFASELSQAVPGFKRFSQSMQIIPATYFSKLYEMILERIVEQEENIRKEEYIRDLETILEISNLTQAKVSGIYKLEKGKRRLQIRERRVILEI